jgi:putative membrane protein
MTGTWLRSGALMVAMSVAAAASYAQGSAGTQSTGSTSAGGQSDRADPGQTSGAKDKHFVETMMMANMAEIQLGQMGSEKATSPDVKSFAQMMVTDHTQANQELMPLAQQLGVQQPTSLDAKHKAVADRLSKLQGAEFDRQYMKAMVAAHKDVISQAKPIAGSRASGGSATGTSGTMSGSGSSAAGSSSGTSAGASSTGSRGGAASVTGYAAKTLPILQQHLARAEQVEQSVDHSKK